MTTYVDNCECSLFQKCSSKTNHKMQKIMQKTMLINVYFVCKNKYIFHAFSHKFWNMLYIYVQTHFFHKCCSAKRLTLK